MLSIATPDDLAEIQDLLKVLFSGSATGRMDESKAHGAISEIVNSSQCLIVRFGGLLVGSAGLYMGDSTWFSRDRALLTRWFFVHPQHRADINANGENAGHATKLIAGAKAAARAAGVPFILSIDTNPEAVCSLKYFKKHLRQCAGTFYYMPEAA